VETHGTAELAPQSRRGRRAGSGTHTPGHPLVLQDAVPNPT
jgi:hypothetical protein